ncbi:MAG: FeoB-associated Cys-rich membrane protein [Bacillota bacterium]|nr:FeoB-associated Cys-rich membrane protein [Bacillota bacterium]
MIDFIVAGIILILLASAITYIVKAKKKGVKCIGCPAAGTCSKAHGHDAAAGCGCTSQCASQENDTCSHS